jgi:4-hydroxy-3-polyprenylbenzoate decarboxylase
MKYRYISALHFVLLSLGSELIYKNTRDLILDLEKAGELERIKRVVDPHLEMAKIHLDTFKKRGPALLFENIKNCKFQAVSNIFGSEKRSQYIFRLTLETVKQTVAIKSDLKHIFKNPLKLTSLPLHIKNALPKKEKFPKNRFTEINISDLPQIQCWPKDGGAFITLPQVFSRDPKSSAILSSNMGMYRIQISGNEYQLNEEIGLHYQIERGIAAHHSRAIRLGKPLKISIFIGGPPAHSLAAVMPLPEGISEVAFAGLLAGRRFRYSLLDDYVVANDADFVILGTVQNDTLLPEGPFGDHLGYYSLRHKFPVVKIETVLAGENAILPFTVVGRPPQEDTYFGKLIHEIAAPAVPKELPGLIALHAVDAAGVHPLLLAIGQERYVPYTNRQPMELLKIANAILGFGQTSLAKYVLIAATEDNPNLDIHHIEPFFQHILERIDFTRDLHFQTNVTMDTLDYSHKVINEGSKVILAAAGDKKRVLCKMLPDLFDAGPYFQNPQYAMPGVIVLEETSFSSTGAPGNLNVENIKRLSLREKIQLINAGEQIALIVIADDSKFTAENIDNFLWVTFTRSDPASDIYGIGEYVKNKHWGCTGAIVIDAQKKAHHAPALEEDNLQK